MLKRFSVWLRLAAAVCLWSTLCVSRSAGADAGEIRALFLGDNGHHAPAARYGDLQPALAARGIQLEYTDRVEDLSSAKLAPYDCLIIYANLERISPDQETALLEYVAGGKGFVPIHCASYCFLNSPRYIELVGAQFQRHGTGTFRTIIAEPEHPIFRGFGGFESWDETYVHHRHNEKDRQVLEYRAEGEGREPWSWVRTHGKGRIFYTAWGHDGRTWTHPGFQNLIERGIRWAVGGDPAAAPAYTDAPQMTPRRTDVKPFEFTDATVPYYPAGQPWGTVGEPFRKMQAPLEPEESLKHLVTPVGFEVKLFASEPEIVKPIGMAWDERGRLWIAETLDYPNDKQPEQEGHDRIQILEDTNGDGRADKFIIFADKLSLPTTLAFARGGVVVQQAPHTLFLRDRDGDDVADERQVLFTGWSTGDTHAGPSNLRYGFDNWLWGIVGYSGYEGQAGGERHSFRQGFYRFKPDGSKVEFLRNTNNNSWGVGFSEEGISFGSTANGNPSVHLPIPNRYYEAVRGWSSSVLDGISGNPRMHLVTDKVRQVDYHGGFTSAAGHALYTARSYPREYWNRAAFVAEPTGHILATFLLQPNGAEFRSRNAWNLVGSDDEWTAPIAADVGPDGQVWVIDWYNYIVQHNPTPAGFRTGKGNAYLTPLRDKKHGRILRVVWPGKQPKQPSPSFTLKDAAPALLVSTLKHENLLWRLHAQRLLVERGEKDVVPALIELSADPKLDELGLSPGAIHALWALHGLGVLDGKDSAAVAAAVKALRHPSAGVRRNAALVLPRTAESSRALLEAGLARDADGQVRLAAFLTLAEMPPDPQAADAIAAALEEPRNLRDRWLVDAMTCAAAANDQAFLRALLTRPRPADAAGSPSAAGSTSAAVLTLARRVAEHHGRGGQSGGIGDLLAALDAEKPGKAVSAAVIAGLARGWPKDAAVKLDAQTEERLARLLESLPPAGRGQLVSLASRWGSETLKKHGAEIAASFLSLAANEKESDTTRVDGARQLIEFQSNDPDAAGKVLALISVRTSSDLAKGLLEAVGRSEADQTGQAIVEALPALTPAGRAAALGILLGRTSWTFTLLEAFERGDVQPIELSLDQKQALAGHPDRRVSRRARDILGRGAGLPSPDRQQVVEKLLPLAEKKGDAAKGKLVYEKQCSKCHVHGDLGTRIGPDLTGMAVHPKAELLTQILDPSRSVEGNYRVYTVVTKDGRVLNGLLSSESKTALELIDTEAKKQVIQRQDAARLVASAKSLMPDGFENQVPPEDLVDLLEFLAQRGKYLPLPLGKAATIVSTRGMFNSEESSPERLIFADWTPKVFEGVPFLLVDPQGDRVPNVVLLYGPQGRFPPRMPKSVRLPCNSPAKQVHLLSGVSGWGFPNGRRGSVSMIVRLHYADGKTEDHPLRNGEHFADYIRRVDVPGSKLAYQLRNQQIRYLTVQPGRKEPIQELELVKGEDNSAPIVMAVTVETP